VRVLSPDTSGAFALPAIKEEGPSTEPADVRMAYGAMLLRAFNAVIDRCGPQKGAIRRP
jgi:hypothetical protein